MTMLSEERLPGASRTALRPTATLTLVCVAITAAEAVAATSAHTSAALAPQAAGPIAFGVFHDLRWLLLLHTSVTGFVAGALAAIAARTALAAWLTRLAWPLANAQHPANAQPSWRRALATSAAFCVLATAVELPLAGLVFASRVASVSWLTFAAIPTLFIGAAIAATGGIQRRWWAHRPSARATITVVAVIVAQSAFGAALTAAPGWLAGPIGAIAGTGDALAWRALATIAAQPRRTHRLNATTLAAGFSAVVLVGTSIGFHVTRLHPVMRPATPTTANGIPVLVASGFGTPWDGASPHYLGAAFAETRFSYAGLDSRGLPEPFVGRQTYAALPTLVERMAAQVRRLAQTTGERVDIVAESEGALVAETYLHAVPDAPVGRVVLLSPLVEPGRVSYPAGDTGRSPVAGIVLRRLSRGLELLGSEQMHPDNALLSSVAAHGSLIAPLLGCAVPGVAQLAVPPLADATSTLYVAPIAMPTTVVAGFHGGLLAHRDVEKIAAAFLRTGHAPPSPVPHAAWRVTQALASAWQQPTLPTPKPDCARTDTALRQWVARAAAG